MPLTVICPGCHSRFQVSEKFAGKQGPCPKCKKVITIPKLEEQVQIHVPEPVATGGKTSTGQPILKPIARTETNLSPVMIASIVGSVVGVLAVAFVLGKSFESGPPWPVAALGALILSPVLAFAGYTFLRNDDLEPYRGRELLVRAAICGTVYAALWGAYALVPVEFKADMWWLYISPPFLFIGSAGRVRLFRSRFGHRLSALQLLCAADRDAGPADERADLGGHHTARGSWHAALSCCLEKRVARWRHPLYVTPVACGAAAECIGCVLCGGSVELETLLGRGMRTIRPLDNLHRVYCAGPLFNAAERREMLAMADVLRRGGFEPFVPHADGMEFAQVQPYLVEQGYRGGGQVGQWLHEAVFALDMYQVAVGCGSLVFNMNGRVPDEGAVAEATMAWMLGKPVVLFKEDARSAIAGRDNPLIVGQSGFRHGEPTGQIGTRLGRLHRPPRGPTEREIILPTACGPHRGGRRAAVAAVRAVGS